jgi:hypothetical protein
VAELCGHNVSRSGAAPRAKRSKKEDWEIIWPVPVERLAATNDRPLDFPKLPLPLRCKVKDEVDLYPYRTAEGRVLLFAARFVRLDTGERSPGF